MCCVADSLWTKQHVVLKMGREKTETCTQAKKFPQGGQGKKGKLTKH